MTNHNAGMDSFTTAKLLFPLELYPLNAKQAIPWGHQKRDRKNTTVRGHWARAGMPTQVKLLTSCTDNMLPLHQILSMKPLPVAVLVPSWPSLQVGLPLECSPVLHGSQPTQPEALAIDSAQMMKKDSDINSVHFNRVPLKHLFGGELTNWIDRMLT